MTATIAEPPALLGYQLRLPSFEGPLDVLLRLIERSQLPISDVSLVSVTQQFLSHVASLGGVGPDVLAEFTAVGARLVVLKSRSLLPRPPVVDEGESDLARDLIEYQAVKLAASRLAELDRVGAGLYGRTTVPAELANSLGQSRLAMHEPSLLVRAMRRRLSVLPTPISRLTVAPAITLREMVERLLLRLDSACFRPLRFSQMAIECANSSEVRTAFLALLVLIRRRVVDAEQEEPFGEIAITSTATGTVGFAVNGLDE